MPRVKTQMNKKEKQKFRNNVHMNLAFNCNLNQSNQGILGIIQGLVLSFPNTGDTCLTNGLWFHIPVLTFRFLFLKDRSFARVSSWSHVLCHHQLRVPIDPNHQRWPMRFLSCISIRLINGQLDNGESSCPR